MPKTFLMLRFYSCTLIPAAIVFEPHASQGHYQPLVTVATLPPNSFLSPNSGQHTDCACNKTWQMSPEVLCVSYLTNPHSHFWEVCSASQPYFQGTENALARLTQLIVSGEEMTRPPDCRVRTTDANPRWCFPQDALRQTPDFLCLCPCIPAVFCSQSVLLSPSTKWKSSHRAVSDSSHPNLTPVNALCDSF